MKIRKAVLACATAAALTLVMAAIPAASATGSPFGTYRVCNATVQDLCMSVDGTEGHDVYAELPDSSNKEKTTVTAANVCSGTDKVNGPGACPFNNGSGLNTKYNGDLIVQMHNTYENNVYYLGESVAVPNPNLIVQGDQGAAGYEWVLAPVTGNPGYYYLINVHVSDVNGTSEWACTNLENPVEVTAVFLGDGYCEFKMQP